MPRLRTLLATLLLGLALSFTITTLLPATLGTNLFTTRGIKQALGALQARFYSTSSTSRAFIIERSTNMSTRTPVYFLSHGMSILQHGLCFPRGSSSLTCSPRRSQHLRRHQTPRPPQAQRDRPRDHTASQTQSRRGLLRALASRPQCRRSQHRYLHGPHL